MIKKAKKTVKKAKTEKKAPEKKPAVKKQAKYIYGLGRRKTAIAKVRLTPGGKGQITVNDREFQDYFPTLDQQRNILQPLAALGVEKRFDIIVNTYGGGVHAQSEAVKLGLARALVKENPESKTTLKKHGLMTRDSRKKERKKPGLKGARRAPQWQKR